MSSDIIEGKNSSLFRSFFHFLVALYLGFWFGRLIPLMLDASVLGYLTVGLLGSCVLMIAGLYAISNYKMPRSLSVLIVLLNFVFVVLALFYPANWLLFVLTVFQGLLVSLCLSLAPSNTKKFSSFWSLGLVASFIGYLIPYDITTNDNKIKHSSETIELISETSIQTSPHIGIFVLLFIIMIALVYGVFKLNSESSKTDKLQNSESNKLFQTIGLTISGLLILTEISFFFWSLVLKDESQSIVHQATLPSVFVLLFIFRKYLGSPILKVANISWLFAMTTTLTLALGYFYTFDINIIFVIIFSLSLAFSVSVALIVFNQQWDHRIIGSIMLVSAIIFVIGGLYIQNHIEFIQSIKVPKNVWHLSARQAWVKELASVSALVMILVGIVFLKRRSWIKGGVIVAIVGILF